MKTIIGGWNEIEYAYNLLKNGKLVAFPTETVYGLGANIYKVNAVKKIFEVKGRPQDNPLIAHIHDFSLAHEIAKDIPETAYMLWEKFSPGPLTLVLKKRKCVPDIVTAGLDTIAIRIPNNQLALELLRKCAFPIVAPSANISGRVSPTLAQHVFEDLNSKIPLILDSGECLVGIESTVLDVTKTIPTILRPGFITEKDISKVLGKVINHKGEVIKAESPGMKYRHYAPRCRLILAKNVAEATKLATMHERAIILGTKQFVDNIYTGETRVLGSNVNECMKNYYKILRDLEKEYACIIVEDLKNRTGYQALYNRLIKSCSNNEEGG